MSDKVRDHSCVFILIVIINCIKILTSRLPSSPKIKPKAETTRLKPFWFARTYCVGTANSARRGSWPLLCLILVSWRCIRYNRIVILTSRLPSSPKIKPKAGTKKLIPLALTRIVGTESSIGQGSWPLLCLTFVSWWCIRYNCIVILTSRLPSSPKIKPKTGTTKQIPLALTRIIGTESSIGQGSWPLLCLYVFVICIKTLTSRLPPKSNPRQVRQSKYH